MCRHLLHITESSKIGIDISEKNCVILVRSQAYNCFARVQARTLDSSGWLARATLAAGMYLQAKASNTGRGKR